jgi:putative ABC transport system permease protein
VGAGHRDPERVVAVLTTDPARDGYGWDEKPVSAPDFVAWRDQSQSFEGMVAGEDEDFELTGEGEPERLFGMRVSPDYFALLGVAPSLGRTFLPGEDPAGNSEVVVLSHRLWQRRFDFDPAIIGRTVRLNGHRHTVTGIMPAHFKVGYYDPQLWAPLVLAPERLLPGARANHSLHVLARLKPGVNPETASAEMAMLAVRADRACPATTRGWGARAKLLQRYLADEFTTGMTIQMTAVLLVLLIACANVASLQLARAAARQPELALRAALGASRLRLVRQLLLESLLVAALAGGLGLILASWGMAGFRRGLSWDDYVRSMAAEIVLDPGVLAFTIAISGLAAVLFGLAPALNMTATDLQVTMKDGGRTVSCGRGRRRAHSSLVAAQIALAVALLAGAGFFIEDFAYEVYAGLGSTPSRW